MEKQTMITEDYIFKCSMDDVCPCCGNDHVDDKYQTAETNAGGKTMAYYMRCPECGSTWRVGMNRRAMPIKSKIINNLTKAT